MGACARFAYTRPPLVVGVLASGNMTETTDALAWLGRYSLVAVVASLAACYGTRALGVALSALGIGFPVNHVAWATLVAVFAWTGVLAMGVNLRRHGAFAPFLLGDLGALTLSWVMFVDSDRVMEVIGFVLLVTGAIWDRNLRLKGMACRD